ncbi:hypothetical protein IAT40_007521 [Kwoniella sp. CBS 6097]
MPTSQTRSKRARHAPRRVDSDMDDLDSDTSSSSDTTPLLLPHEVADPTSYLVKERRDRQRETADLNERLKSETDKKNADAKNHEEAFAAETKRHEQIEAKLRIELDYYRQKEALEKEESEWKDLLGKRKREEEAKELDLATKRAKLAKARRKKEESQAGK